MKRTTYLFASAGVGAVALLAAQAVAAPPVAAPVTPGAAHAPAAAAAGQKEHSNGKPGLLDKAETKSGQTKENKEKTDEKGQGQAKSQGQAGGNAEQAAQPVAQGQDHRGAWREFAEEIRTGKVKKAEIKERLAGFDKDRPERKARHQSELRERFGQELAKPAALEELKHHARRMAFLNRMLIVAQTERAGKVQQKLVERVEALITKEEARHDKKMDGLKASSDSNAKEPAEPAADTAASAAPGEKAAPVEKAEPTEKEKGGAQ